MSANEPPPIAEVIPLAGSNLRSSAKMVSMMKPSQKAGMAKKKNEKPESDLSNIEKGFLAARMPSDIPRTIVRIRLGIIRRRVAGTFWAITTWAGSR